MTRSTECFGEHWWHACAELFLDIFFDATHISTPVYMHAYLCTILDACHDTHVDTHMPFHTCVYDTLHTHIYKRRSVNACQYACAYIHTFQSCLPGRHASGVLLSPARGQMHHAWKSPDVACLASRTGIVVIAIISERRAIVPAAQVRARYPRVRTHGSSVAHMHLQVAVNLRPYRLPPAHSFPATAGANCPGEWFASASIRRNEQRGPTHAFFTSDWSHCPPPNPPARNENIHALDKTCHRLQR